MKGRGLYRAATTIQGTVCVAALTALAASVGLCADFFDEYVKLQEKKD